jgi:hypothetical protein
MRDAAHIPGNGHKRRFVVFPTEGDGAAISNTTSAGGRATTSTIAATATGGRNLTATASSGKKGKPTN